MTGNRIDFSKSLLNKHLDNIPDGSSRVALATTHASGNVAYNFKGNWNSGTSYVIGDEVSYAGTYWLCTAANSNSAPTFSNSNWQQMGVNIQAQGDSTGRTTNVAATTILTAPVRGFYLVMMALYVSPTSIGTTTITPTIAWTQNTKSVSVNGAAASGNTSFPGVTSMMQLIYADAGTNIQYSTSGTFNGGSKLDVHIRVVGPV
jgi:hypothetical protein